MTNGKDPDKNERVCDGYTLIMIALWEAYDDSHHVERAIKIFIFVGMKKYR